MENKTDKKWLRWGAPVGMLLLAALSCLFPLTVPVGLFLALYFDLRLGGRYASCGWTLGIFAGLYLSLGAAGLILAPALLIPLWLNGYMLRHKTAFMDGVLYTVASVLLSAASCLFAVYFLFHENPVTVMMSGVEESFRAVGDNEGLRSTLALQNAMMEFMTNGGDLETLNALVTELQSLPVDELITRAMPHYEELFRLYAPTLAAVYVAAMTACCWICPGFAIKHRKVHGEALAVVPEAETLPPSFLLWRLPRLVVVIAVLVTLASFFITNVNNPALVSAFSALEWVARMILCIQGAALAAFFLQGKHVRTGLRVLILLAVYMLVPTVLVLLGLLDSSFGVRRFLLMSRYQFDVKHELDRYKDDPDAAAEKLAHITEMLEKQAEDTDFAIPEAVQTSDHEEETDTEIPMKNEEKTKEDNSDESDPE